MRNYIFVFIGFLFCGSAYAQHQWKTALEKPAQTGFYKLVIDPVLGTKLNADLSDLRITEGSKHVPYLVNERINFRESIFRSLPITNNTTDSNGTTVVIDARTETGLSDLSVVVANTAVQRQASLSGSRDGINWFIIHESLELSSPVTNADGHFVQSLIFPYTKYEYFKLLIRNKGTDPLNVLSVGIIQDTDHQRQLNFFDHEGTTFTSLDSAGKTFLHISNKLPYYTEQIELESPSKYFKRVVHIYKSDANRKKLGHIATGFLESSHELRLRFPGLRTAHLLLEIENGDNPPLEVERIYTGETERSITAWLEKDKEYFLLAGDSLARAPQYDLAHFRDSIPANTPLIAYGPFSPNTLVAEETTRNTWLWPAIIGMIAILGFLTYRLMGDMRAKGV